MMLVGRLFHARAAVTRNDRSPMVLSRVLGTIRRGQELDRPARPGFLASVKRCIRMNPRVHGVWNFGGG